MIGISDGAVLQRGKDGTCDIYLVGQVQQISYEGEVCGMAVLAPAADGRVRVTGIPTGGPYTVRLDDQIMHDIYVGDIWILAGQSNMEGNGIYRECDRHPEPDREIRAFYMMGQWGVAAHPLHTPWKAVDRIHRELPGLDESGSSYRGVGPGLMFAQQMKRITGVPQGVLCCAHGGTTLEQWSPALADEGENSLLGSLLKTVERCGGRAAGLFWYQGCSEAMSGYGKPVEEFSERTLALFRLIRDRLDSELPIVQAQISRMVSCFTEDSDLCFTMVREQQRRMKTQIQRLAVIPTVTEELDDLVHLSAAAQDSVGYRAANAMAQLLYPGRESLLPPPEYRSCWIDRDPDTSAAILRVYYDHIDGGLRAEGRAVGFRVGDTPYGNDNRLIFSIRPQDDHVAVYLTAAPEDLKGKYLCYGAGADPVCNIFDGAGRPLPAMAGILLK